ncbi:hypothetical protein BD626DRAFT_567891 [Schizophyllum amplum]|uniref:Thioredoxin domain-containing protein n=1 Tax=Schizophyllum amplum TaxID=97359 RepID=A0A550CJT8_9AGAR|nr:hypothetical protein BD626DRAFT_567891 [Auriculariopsis ampla]
MPIRTLETPDTAMLEAAPEEYFIFYSSVVDGKMWCPDCRDVEGRVNATFTGAKAPSALIVFVGDRPKWKSQDNVYRQAPYTISGVPTLLKLEDGKEVARLVEGDILTSKLDELLER